MHRVISIARKGLLAVLALAALLLGILVWALWPLPDPRFDWKPYYQKLAAQDCRDAARLLWGLIRAGEADAVQATQDLLDQKSCAEVEASPDLQGYLRKAIERYRKAEASGKLPKWDWEPGWEGVWTRRQTYLEQVDRYTAYYFVERLGPWTEYPSAVFSSWRCLMPVTSDAYEFAEARDRLTNDRANPELRQLAWEERVLRCFTMPAMRALHRAYKNGHSPNWEPARERRSRAA